MHPTAFTQKQAKIVNALRKRAEAKGAPLEAELKDIAARKGPDLFWEPSMDDSAANRESYSSRLFSEY